MRVTILIALLALLPAAAKSQQSRDFGDVVVHYSTLTTDMLAADVARAYGITRSARRALLNITVMRRDADGMPAPVSARVGATATNLNGQLTRIRMREVREGSAIYQLGEFRVGDEETFDFEVSVTVDEGAAHTLRFRQQFFTD